MDASGARLLAYPDFAIDPVRDENSTATSTVLPSWMLNPVEVRIGGRLCSNLEVMSDAVIECNVPPGLGTGTEIEVRVCGQRLATSVESLLHG